MNLNHTALRQIPLPSRLPKVGTTIFTVMSALANECQAINLGQGFPDFDCDPALPKAVYDAMQTGHNQYPPMAGIAPLRQAISEKSWLSMDIITTLTLKSPSLLGVLKVSLRSLLAPLVQAMKSL